MPNQIKKPKLNPWDPVQPSKYNWDDLAGPEFAELRKAIAQKDKPDNKQNK